MAKKAYIGVDHAARKVKKIYLGIHGVARPAKKGYVGVNGVARLFFESAYRIVVSGYSKDYLGNCYAVITPDNGVVVPYSYSDTILSLPPGCTIYLKAMSSSNRYQCDIKLNGVQVAAGAKTGSGTLIRYGTSCEYTYTVTKEATIKCNLATAGGDNPIYCMHIAITESNG